MLYPLTDPVVIKALAHPIRMQIVSLLEATTRSPSDLAEILDEPLGKVSYHVRTLADKGLIELVDSQPRRGAVEHYYTLSTRWVIDRGTWQDLPDDVKQSMTSNLLTEICADLHSADDRDAFSDPDAYLTRSHVELDREAQSSLSEKIDQLLRDVATLEEESRQRSEARRVQNGDNGTDRVMIILTAHRSLPDA